MKDSIDFCIARIRQLHADAWHTPEYLAEVAFLYDHIVKTGSHEPIIDMGMKLMFPFAQVGDMVETAMSLGYISAPKKGTWGGKITKQSLKILGLAPTVKRKTRIDSFNCPNCGAKALKRIVYGMPDDNFDFKKNIVGGCIPQAEDVGCKSCEWVGFRRELEAGGSREL
jgi:hypothetical protein